MKTEHWALLISFLALIASVGIPLWQSRTINEQNLAARRSLLLQAILDAKTTTYVSSHQLRYLLQRHGDKMQQQQREQLSSMYPRLRQHYEELEALHDDWLDFKDGAPLTQIEEAMAQVHSAAAEAKETAHVIENGRKSYEDA